MEAAERLEDALDGFVVFDGLARLGEGRVDVVALELFVAVLLGQPSAFQLEVTLERAGVLLNHFEQRVDRFVRHVVGDVANVDRRTVAAQLDVLVVPVADAIDVHLGEHLAVVAIDPIELFIGRLSLFGIGRVGVGHQAVAGQRSNSLAFPFVISLLRLDCG